jgi:integrase
LAHIEDRWFRTIENNGKRQRVPTALNGKGLRYRVRFVGPDGRERSRSFPDREKKAAEAFMVSVESDRLRGSFVDPRAGRMTFREYARRWLTQQTFDETTREVTERRLRRHILPRLGGEELARLRPAQIRELDRHLQTQGLSASYRAVVFSNVATILNAAVDDERIVRNPCHARTLRPPRTPPKRVVPWSCERVLAVRAAMAERYRVMVDLGAGCGLRQGEILGIGVEDLDHVRRLIHVSRQIRIVGNRLVFALPKGRKRRDVPLPVSVEDAIASHRDRVPSLEITLPWEVPTGPPHTARLIIVGVTGVAVDRNMINRDIWQPALARVGVGRSREHGMHALRHFYASVLLDAGESIKALSEYLGHSDPGFTLRTYTHLMPTSEERTRKAVDNALRWGSDSDGDDGLMTA